MGGEHGSKRGVHRVRKLERAVVVGLAEAQASVLLRDVHPERAQLGQALDDTLRDLVIGLDLDWVDLGLEVRVQPMQEVLAPPLVLIGRQGMRVDQVKPEPAGVELASKARQRPFGFTRFFGQAPRLLLCNLLFAHGRIIWLYGGKPTACLSSFYLPPRGDGMICKTIIEPPPAARWTTTCPSPKNWPRRANWTLT